MSGVDFWGEAVPAWISALGGAAAAAVGAAALILSLRNAGGVRTLREAANTSGGSPEDPQRAASLITEDGAADTPAVSPVSWTTWQEHRHRYRLRNDSTNTGAGAHLTGFEDVTPDGDGAAFFAGNLPVDLAPGESIPFTLEKSLVSPSVTAVRVTWVDDDGSERQRTLYI